MSFQQRLIAFVHLGKILAEASKAGQARTVGEAYLYNNWFTEESQRNCFAVWADLLTESKLTKWLNKYPIEEKIAPKNIAIIMAGNIPMVGFHDLLCVLLSGNNATVKMSSDDKILIKWIADELIKFDTSFNEKIHFVEDQIKSNFDAVIATGSNNSNRYFDAYFGKYPNILRKNRNSIAIVDGKETEDEMKLLADDIFSYFGLGCRNVSKVFLPNGFAFEKLYENTHKYSEFIHHNKYANNYTYHKAIWLMNTDKFLDNGFLLMKEENEQFSSPLASIYYQYYNNMDEVKSIINQRESEIQCVVSTENFKNNIPFGSTQTPALNDYADNVDTMKFLTEL